MAVHNGGWARTVEAVRAREPDRRGFVVRDGVRIYYEVAGPEGAASVLLLPAWAIAHSRLWKLQVPFLARQFRVITFDPRGNGRSDRPRDPPAYADTEIAADALAVLDATGTSAAVAVGVSMGAAYLLRLTAAAPERVHGAVFVAPALRLGSPPPGRDIAPFGADLDTDAGWEKYNAHYWRRDLRGFAEFFFGETFAEPHSTKGVDDGVEWALHTDAETLVAIEHAPYVGAGTARLAERVRCPSLVLHGDADRIIDVSTGYALAGLLNCPIEIVRGGGHLPNLRHPVRFNHVLRDFVHSVAVNDACA